MIFNTVPFQFIYSHSFFYNIFYYWMEGEKSIGHRRFKKRRKVCKIDAFSSWKLRFRREQELIRRDLIGLINEMVIIQDYITKVIDKMYLKMPHLYSIMRIVRILAYFLFRKFCDRLFTCAAIIIPPADIEFSLSLQTENIYSVV